MPIDPTSDMQQHIERYCPQCDNFHSPATRCEDATKTCVECGAPTTFLETWGAIVSGAFVSPLCYGCYRKLDESQTPPPGGS